MSDKIDLQLNMDKKDKEGHYRMIKRSIHQKDITIINIQVPNITAFENKKQIQLKGKINSNTVIVGVFNISFSIIDKQLRQIINKKMLDLN